MRVAMVETGGWGGIAHYAWNLCQTLAEAGAEVVLLTNTRYELADLPRAFQVEPCFDGTAGYVRTVCSFRHRLSDLAPDIVHVQSLISTRLDALLWPLVGRRVPLVMTAHNVRSHEGHAWEMWTLWHSLKAADATVTHTQESAQVVAARIGPTARLRVIRHGDYAFFGRTRVGDRQQARSRLGVPAHAKLLLAFGAIRPYKGILQLIAVLPRIRARHPDAHLMIVGPLLVGTEAEYRAAIARAEVGEAVTFRPAYVPHEDVAAYFTSADVAVYNYQDVTDSGSLRIACSLGTPVVATSVGGFREFLTDGVTGRLVPPGTPDRLAETIGEVLADQAGAARMAQAARALCSSAWSWGESAKATMDLYQELLDARHSESPRTTSSRTLSGRPSVPMTPAAPELSVVLITRNEAHRIRRCLDSVRWADELIVVDQHSTDDTAAICREYGATVLTREMSAGFGEQKQFAIEQASRSWILSLDADEVVSAALRVAIQDAIRHPGPHVGFTIPRLTAYLGRFIRHCGWYPKPVLRLFRRGHGRFTDAWVHEEVQVGGPIGELREDLLHFSYDTMSAHLQKLDLYSTHDALMLARRGVRITALNTPWYFCGKPLLVFLRKYLWQGGFREGRHGLILCAMAALVTFVNYAKVWEGTLPDRSGGKDD